MKETIEQAAKEYADGLRSVDKKSTYDNIEVDSSRMVAFKRGAEWHAKQSAWISVKERLPEDHTGVFFIVEWEDKRKNYYVGVYDGNQCWESDYRIFLPNSLLGNVTHWMPIPE